LAIGRTRWAIHRRPGIANAKTAPANSVETNFEHVCRVILDDTISSAAGDPRCNPHATG